MCRKSFGNMVLIIIALFIVLLLVYPAIRNIGLLFYMGPAQKKYWNKVDEVCSENYMWVDDNEKYTVTLKSDFELCVLKNQENGNSMYFVFANNGIMIVDEDDNTLGWGDWDYNEEMQILVLDISWFEDEGVFLKESMQIDEGTSISFYGKEIMQ